MASWIDISVRLEASMPIWPDSAGFHLTASRSFAAGDEVNVSRIDMDVHCGTHVEAPRHFIDGGDPLEALPLDVFIGPARVVHLLDAPAIGAAELETASVPAAGVARLLIRTRNSEMWANSAVGFDRAYVGLTLGGAQWIADHGIRLIGMDYLSVQRFGDDPETHRVLMRAGVTILEGIDLTGVEPGDYQLICQPIRIGDAEAAPARALLEPLT
jgi:arylformamidase